MKSNDPAQTIVGLFITQWFRMPGREHVLGARRGEHSCHANNASYAQRRMSARSHRRWVSWWRRSGARATITACACALVLAGSPQLHQHIGHSGARAGHSCSITLRNAGKCLKAVERPTRPLVVFAPVALPSACPVITPVWVPTLFLEVCCYEHGPPALFSVTLS